MELVSSNRQVARTNRLNLIDARMRARWPRSPQSELLLDGAALHIISIDHLTAPEAAAAGPVW